MGAPGMQGTRDVRTRRPVGHFYGREAGSPDGRTSRVVRPYDQGDDPLLCDDCRLDDDLYCFGCYDEDVRDLRRLLLSSPFRTIPPSPAERRWAETDGVLMRDAVLRLCGISTRDSHRDTLLPMLWAFVDRYHRDRAFEVACGAALRSAVAAAPAKQLTEVSARLETAFRPKAYLETELCKMVCRKMEATPDADVSGLSRLCELLWDVVDCNTNRRGVGDPGRVVAVMDAAVASCLLRSGWVADVVAKLRADAPLWLLHAVRLAARLARSLLRDRFRLLIAAAEGPAGVLRAMSLLGVMIDGLPA